MVRSLAAESRRLRAAMPACDAGRGDTGARLPAVRGRHALDLRRDARARAPRRRGIAQPGRPVRRQRARVAAKRPRRHSRVVRHQPRRCVLRATEHRVSRPPARACDRAVRCARDGRARRTRRPAAGNSGHATRDTRSSSATGPRVSNGQGGSSVATYWITPTTARRMRPSSAGIRR